MNRIFAVLFILAIVVIGVGFSRGWFTLSRSDMSEDSRKTDINLTVDGDKIQEDFEKVIPSETTNGAGEGAHELGDRVRDDE